MALPEWSHTEREKQEGGEQEDVLDGACGRVAFLLDPVSKLLKWLFPKFLFI